ncbi:MAG: biotin synthase BioB [Nitrospirota bacterium]
MSRIFGEDIVVDNEKKGCIILVIVMTKAIDEITQKVINGMEVCREDISLISGVDEYTELVYLFASANRIRSIFRDDIIDICSIINARSGNCGEDCGFCAQSAHHHAKIETYPLVSVERILKIAECARDNGANRFCIVTSGRKVKKGAELETICNAIYRIKNEIGLSTCATLGMLGRDEILLLKESGLHRFHHNLETSRRFFPEICSTHTFDDKLSTIITAKEAGLSICCGGIFGMGETWDDRIDLAYTIKSLGVDSIPINFLTPIDGTPLSRQPLLNPFEALKIISIFRFVMPDKEIRVCGGRIHVIKGLQPLVLLAGADGLLTGNYLTTLGRMPEEDLEMINDLGLRIKGQVVRE